MNETTSPQTPTRDSVTSSVLLDGLGRVSAENSAMRTERDETYTWLVQVAVKLNVRIAGFRSNDVAEQYRELRERIMAALPSNDQAHLRVGEGKL